MSCSLLSWIVTRTITGTDWNSGGFRTIGTRLKAQRVRNYFVFGGYRFRIGVVGLVGSIVGAVCVSYKFVRRRRYWCYVNQMSNTFL